ncbi:MAG: S24 family peptidase [Bryobacter sp.]|nr:S24 family peptidase [Bryobacter sp.]
MTFSVLELVLPGVPPTPAGVLLYDAEANRLGVKLRRDWVRLGEEAELEEEDLELLAAFEGEIKRRAAAEGAGTTFRWLEDTLSNVLRLSERRSVGGTATPGFEFLLHQLYRDTVPTRVEPFVTHLPRYALRSAAGPFSAVQDTAEAEDPAEWVEAPPGLRLSRDMFVIEIQGESMLPLIPSGSLCVFRKFGAGSRNGKKVLVEDRSARAGGARYTVKIYHSEKSATGGGASADGEWAHQRVWLESLNPAFAPIELEPDAERYVVVAEYLGLLDQ